jgi:hypothetical protein
MLSSTWDSPQELRGVDMLSTPTDFALLKRPARGEDANEKASDFTPGVYYPELLRTMGGALDAAWQTFKPTPKDTELARVLMAKAIIEATDAGVRKHEFLVDKAVRALRAAIKADREALIEEPKAVAAR